MGVQINEVHRIDFNGQIIISTSEELEELCLALEEHLYDDPNYDELSKKVTDLEIEIESLQQALEYHRSLSDGRA
ncbi:hypothetical protein [Proteiniborus sp.]|uniref:hypothetical protein n=1 Tax=Proteiniborus sp. TaxID=2079015 RepID=UPI0033285467